MALNKDKALKIIINCAKIYNEELKDNNFKIFYIKDSEQKSVEIQFRDTNFKHLTGVETKIPAKMFYEACISNKLSVNDFKIDNKGNVQRKLNVLPALNSLFTGACQIGPYDERFGIKLRSDYMVGKNYICVGFKKQERKDFPITLLSEDIRKQTHPTYKVIKIMKKKYFEKEYSECVYVSKN